MLPTVSLLITTYNWKEALRCSLLSAFAQKVLPKEILIADDGSRDDTRQMIDELREQSPVPLVHIWHDDDGFRLSAIRNKAIAAASGDYIIQIDGDIILNRNFISDHLEIAKEGCFVCGSRVKIDAKQSDKILKGEADFLRLCKPTPNSMRSHILRLYLADRFAKGDVMRLRGCNMAFWRKDLIRVNGYNEDLVSWGHEDSELAYRLVFAGVHKRFLKMGGVCFHIHHKMASRDGEAKQLTVLQQLIERKDNWTGNGLDKHLL